VKILGQKRGNVQRKKDVWNLYKNNISCFCLWLNQWHNQYAKHSPTKKKKNTTTLEGTGLYTRHRMQNVKNKGLQIFQKSISHLEILEARMTTRSKFHTDNPQPKSNIRTSLFSGAFSSVHELRWGGSSCVQNIRHHCTTFSCLGDQSPGICAYLLKRILLCGSLKDILNTHKEVLCCSTYVFQQTFQIHKLPITHWPLQNHSFMNTAN
jgi:hypothetical protein